MLLFLFLFSMIVGECSFKNVQMTVVCNVLNIVFFIVMYASLDVDVNIIKEFIDMRNDVVFSYCPSFNGLMFCYDN